jgi:hypothetical protein
MADTKKPNKTNTKSVQKPKETIVKEHEVNVKISIGKPFIYKGKEYIGVKEVPLNVAEWAVKAGFGTKL